MRRPFSLIIAVVFAAIAILNEDALAPAPAYQPAANVTMATTRSVYVALGDSLAASWQPDATGRNRATSKGYVDVVGRALRRIHTSLDIERLSCGGATAGVLLNGSPSCNAAGAGSQVQRAEQLLHANPGAVLVTVNIGDNDIEACINNRTGAVDQACMQSGEAGLRANLPSIAQRLRAAAPPDTPVVGLVDYDQFLSLWLDGPRGRSAARQSLQVIDALNAEMTTIYRKAGVLVADASDRFATNDFKDTRFLRGHGMVPLNVYKICTLTWACSGGSIGHNDHATPSGYRQLGLAILDALRDASGASGGTASSAR